MVFTGIEEIEDGFYYKFSEGDNASVGDMVIWNNQKIKSKGETLSAEYNKIKEATTNMLRHYGLSWDTLTY